MNVGYALRRAKHTIDDARRNSPNVSQAEAALNQVSDWLTTAAETSDRALRSLESEPHQVVKSRSEIFTSNDLHDS
jgi:ABC-type transporter Mla subunit MlaD